MDFFFCTKPKNKTSINYDKKLSHVLIFKLCVKVKLKGILLQTIAIGKNNLELKIGKQFFTFTKAK